MESAQQQVEKLLGQIREVARNQQVERLTDQITVLCRAVLSPCVDDRWMQYNLTGCESKLMAFLAERPGFIRTKGAMLDAIYFDRPNNIPELKIVDVFVCKIRAKIKNSPWQIDTIWGQGYRLNHDASLEPPVPAKIGYIRPGGVCKCGRGEKRPNQSNCHACNREANAKYEQSLRTVAA